MLPFERDGEAAHPLLPFGNGLRMHRVNRLSDVADEAFVGTEEEVERPLETLQGVGEIAAVPAPGVGDQGAL